MIHQSKLIFLQLLLTLSLRPDPRLLQSQNQQGQDLNRSSKKNFSPTKNTSNYGSTYDTSDVRLGGVKIKSGFAPRRNVAQQDLELERMQRLREAYENDKKIAVSQAKVLLDKAKLLSQEQESLKQKRIQIQSLVDAANKSKSVVLADRSVFLSRKNELDAKASSILSSLAANQNKLGSLSSELSLQKNRQQSLLQAKALAAASLATEKSRLATLQQKIDNLQNQKDKASAGLKKASDIVKGLEAKRGLQGFEKLKISPPIFSAGGVKFLSAAGGAGLDDKIIFVPSEISGVDYSLLPAMFEKPTPPKLKEGELPKFDKQEPRLGDPAIIKRYDTKLQKLEPPTLEATNLVFSEFPEVELMSPTDGGVPPLQIKDQQDFNLGRMDLLSSKIASSAPIKNLGEEGMLSLIKKILAYFNFIKGEASKEDDKKGAGFEVRFKHIHSWIEELNKIGKQSAPYKIGDVLAVFSWIDPYPVPSAQSQYSSTSILGKTQKNFDIFANRVGFENYKQATPTPADISKISLRQPADPVNKILSKKIEVLVKKYLSIKTLLQSGKSADPLAKPISVSMSEFVRSLRYETQTESLNRNVNFYLDIFLQLLLRDGTSLLEKEELVNKKHLLLWIFLDQAAREVNYANPKNLTRDKNVVFKTKDFWDALKPNLELNLEKKREVMLAYSITAVKEAKAKVMEALSFNKDFSEANFFPVKWNEKPQSITSIKRYYEKHYDDLLSRLKKTAVLRVEDQQLINNLNAEITISVAKIKNAAEKYKAQMYQYQKKLREQADVVKRDEVDSRKSIENAQEEDFGKILLLHQQLLQHSKDKKEFEEKLKKIKANKSKDKARAKVLANRFEQIYGAGGAVENIYQSELENRNNLFKQEQGKVIKQHAQVIEKARSAKKSQQESNQKMLQDNKLNEQAIMKANQVLQKLEALEVGFKKDLQKISEKQLSISEISTIKKTLQKFTSDLNKLFESAKDLDKQKDVLVELETVKKRVAPEIARVKKEIEAFQNKYQDSEKILLELEDAKKDLAIAEKQSDALERELISSSNEKINLDKKISILSAEVDQAEKHIANASAVQQKVLEDITLTQNNLEKEKDLLEKTQKQAEIVEKNIEKQDENISSFHAEASKYKQEEKEVEKRVEEKTKEIRLIDNQITRIEDAFNAKYAQVQ